MDEAAAEALAPACHRFRDASYERLCAALALIFGAESMIVFRDVLGVDPDTARAVKSWAMRALVRAALEESAAAVPRSAETGVDANRAPACPEELWGTPPRVAPGNCRAREDKCTSNCSIRLMRPVKNLRHSNYFGEVGRGKR